MILRQLMPTRSWFVWRGFTKLSLDESDISSIWMKSWESVCHSRSKFITSMQKSGNSKSDINHLISNPLPQHLVLAMAHSICHSNYFTLVVGFENKSIHSRAKFKILGEFQLFTTLDTSSPWNPEYVEWILRWKTRFVFSFWLRTSLCNAAYEVLHTLAHH